MIPLSSSSSSPPLSPPPVLPWGRLVPSGGMHPPVDLMPSQKEYWLGRSSTKCDVPIVLAKNTNKKETTMMAWAHSMISNKHCRILCDTTSAVYLEDQSGNGTIVNQTTELRKGQLRLLHSGDEICLVNATTLRKKIASARLLQKVLLQYTFIFVQPSKPRRSCVNPRAMKYRPSTTPTPAARRIESIYELREKIGDGTSGQVRRAIHRQTGQEFAVKVICLRRQLDNKQMEEEVSLMRTLDHPYIVQLVDVFVQSGVAMYLVMELVAGGDLFDRIVQQERYTEVNARRAMRRLLSAVHYLHETCHIVHRDLKPENILCTSPTHVKLADFGLAKIVKGDGLKTFCGTPQYFAPEVLQRRNTVTGQGRYGKPADMWSLGVILYILLTGKPPFGMVDFMEVGEDDDPYAQLKFDNEELWNTMPKAKNLVQQLLRLDPKRRLSVRQACDHPWINTDDGDTHVHPLDDPAVTGRKRLFDASKNNGKQQQQQPNVEEKKEESDDQPPQQHKSMSKEAFASASLKGQTHSSMEVDESHPSGSSLSFKHPNKGDETLPSLFQDAVSKQPSLPNLATLNVLSTSSKMIIDDDDKETSTTTEEDLEQHLTEGPEPKMNTDDDKETSTTTKEDPEQHLTEGPEPKMNTDDDKETSTTTKEDPEQHLTEEPEPTTTESSSSKTTTSPTVLVTPSEFPVTPEDGEVIAPLPNTPLANLNQRGNHFRQSVLEHQMKATTTTTTKSKQQETTVASPEVQLREPNLAAVTPNVSDVQTPKEQQPEEEDDDDIISQFSEPEPSSLESFPESPAATNSNRKRPLEESEDLQQSDAKRRNKNSRQTTLSSWFVKTT
jgi:serine/threonine protein kinase